MIWRVFLFVSTIVGSVIVTLALIVVALNFWFIKLDKDKVSDEKKWRAINWVTSWAVPLVTFSSVEVEGLEHIDKHERAVVYANHHSIFDIFAFLKAVDRPHGYIAKEEIGNIFLLSRGMRLIHCEFLNREDTRGAAKTILSAIKTVKRGHMMVIFPEGTRVIHGPLGLFKAGSFKVAQKADAHIIPVTFHNTEVVPTRWPRHTKIRVTIHEPIAPEAYADMSTSEIAMKVETIVKGALK